MKVKFAGKAIPKTGNLVLLVTEKSKLDDFCRDFDDVTIEHLNRAIKVADFKGKHKSSLNVIAPAGSKLKRVLLVGVGKNNEYSLYRFEEVGGVIAANMLKAKQSDFSLFVGVEYNEEFSASDIASYIASGIQLRSYNFTKYKTKKDDEKDKDIKLENISIFTDESDDAKKQFANIDAVNIGVNITRDFVNEPPNVLYPGEFAKRIKKLSDLGLDIEILDKKEMEKLGMNALLAVGQGSCNDSKLVIMQWNGGKKNIAPLAFVGKGVTFDTGGISLKPGAGMGDMKGDMAGAACVVGLLAALAGRKAKVNAVGVVGLVENMPDGKAQRPGDIITSMSGQTIEVLNTDAEGRLVLADALWYTQDRFKPKFMINLATLTGAILVALGKEHAGIFSNDDDLCMQLSTSGNHTGEKVWRLPINDDYDKLINTPNADMKNIGGSNAGSITAAQFLQRHVNSVPWVHIDIAGTGMSSKKNAINTSWGSGYGVRLLNNMIYNYYE